MNSVRTRLTLWFSLAVTVATVGTVWSGHLFFVSQMRSGIDFLLDAEIQELIHRLDDLDENAPAAKIREALDDHAKIDAPLYYFQVHNAALGLIYRSPNLGAIVLPDLTGREEMVASFMHENMHLRVMERYYHGLHVQVATSLEQFDTLRSRLLHLLWIGTPVLLLGSVAIGSWLAAMAFKPVAAMQAAATRISATNLSERLPVPPGDDDIAKLARLLNELFARLEASFEQIKRFTADASHEIRTPLSLVRLHAERLERSVNLNKDERKAVSEQLEEIARLNRLVESLLLLARADSGNLPLVLRTQPTAAFVEGVAEDASVLAEEAGIEFRLEKNVPMKARFDATLLRQVFFNGFTNALRHTPAGGTLTFSSSLDGDQWMLILEDDGPGLPEEEIARVFDRFVRGPCRSDAPKLDDGSGLGLAIARSIVQAHHGNIRAENRQPHGLRLIITLPGATPIAEPVEVF